MGEKSEDQINDKIFKITQKFLQNPPLIIWGSGATIPFGLPSMSDLNKALKEKIKDFDCADENIEVELDKEKYQGQMPQIKKVIWDKVNTADASVLQNIVNNNIRDLNGIKLLLEKFIDAHPKVLNIVTTNYDRVLEYMMSYYNIEFTDGFDGKILSIFEEDQFQDKNIVNLVKVHGSLNWFDINEETRYLSCHSESNPPQIIVPIKEKYREAFEPPYRELIQKSDNLIENSSSFLVIGFGFNDKHLTPKVIKQINNGTPIVLITRKISCSSFEALKRANKYILFEEADGNKTKIIYKENDSEEEKEEILEGGFWALNEFMEIL